MCKPTPLWLNDDEKVSDHQSQEMAFRRLGCLVGNQAAGESRSSGPRYPHAPAEVFFNERILVPSSVCIEMVALNGKPAGLFVSSEFIWQQHLIQMPFQVSSNPR
ncbi:MAG: hypothetical protein CMN78_00175 [Spirochaetales bacterium]|nr:hypothetical protein [Spirochaetales bacterium]